MRNHDTLLAPLHSWKSRELPSGVPLGPELIGFFKQSVAKRQTKLVKIAECWASLVPEMLNDHCSLESLNRGTLTVLVDSSSHLYELEATAAGGVAGSGVACLPVGGIEEDIAEAGAMVRSGFGESVASV